LREDSVERGQLRERAPTHWEALFGSGSVHVILTGVAPDAAALEAAVDRARAAFTDLSGIAPIWRQDCYAPPDEKEPFGFKDGISHPAIEGSGVPGSNPLEAPLKTGELVLGYRDDPGGVPESVPGAGAN
jgi:deferrochelatase/peroxidase EfeB